MLKKTNFPGERALIAKRKALVRKKKGTPMLKGNQNKLDVDKDGEITGKDFKMLKKIKKK
tara:strand:- start:1017 stop:1196 length:180 start_codon:yes stop_codon:yes gene_type:complete